MKRLGVELYGDLIGTLRGADSTTFDIRADPDAIERYGVNSRILSAAIPLTPKPNRAKAKHRRNFFRELLPEGDQLAAMNAAAGLASGDVLGFLSRYGRDIAGALQIWDLDDPNEPPTPELLPVTAARVRELLDEPFVYPLANRPAVGKTSLAGVQPKIVLARTDDGWAQAVGGAPSTHILKPVVRQHPTLIYDEEYGARLARVLGLASHDTWMATFAGTPALVIERWLRAGVCDLRQSWSTKLSLLSRRLSSWNTRTLRPTHGSIRACGSSLRTSAANAQRGCAPTETAGVCR
ncbi:type II toxin-antitoxin system HipA family toxin [Nocardia speluncae]|uniref:Type II toxin-antitoxin system HipA family toxin n=1 Tax=Nocardia speluncae TaxID=419477 RepID=A0A846XUG5_9NOCA|nr:HipA N-terminal domain-containing protein [Nocardia speluncae]NKY37164.1 type II toxin-antitoxin system HipA family toxin [Nocardia speluncae]